MRSFYLASGGVLLAVIWFGPLLRAWRESFASGMIAHMGVVAVAAPLLAMGMRGIRWPWSGGSMPVALPVVASLVELIVVWGWHAPAMRRVSEASFAGTVAEQATFLAAGVLLWWTSFIPTGERTQIAAGAFALLLTSIHMTLLGALLSLGQRSLYGGGEVTCFGVPLDATQDQQLGGIIMLLVGAVVYLFGCLVLVGRLLDHGQRADSGPPEAQHQVDIS